MESKNMLIGATMAMIGGLFLGGIINDNQHLANLAAASSIYDVIRLAIFCMLGSLLVWVPPRSRRFRGLLAFAGIGLMLSAFWLIATFAVNALDILLFVEAAIIFAIEALELQPSQIKADKPSATNA